MKQWFSGVIYSDVFVMQSNARYSNVLHRYCQVMQCVANEVFGVALFCHVDVKFSCEMCCIGDARF